jgi:hypothetical protein
MDNYERGLRGIQRDINQDYHQYSKGKNIRELTQGPEIPRGGGGCFGILIILIALLPIVLISAFSALCSALLLKLYVRIIEIDHRILTFKGAFKILFKMTIIYQVILSVVYYSILYYQQTFSSYTELTAENIKQLYTSAFGLYFALQIVPILFAANFLRKKLSVFKKFKGVLGFLRSTCFIICTMTIIPTLLYLLLIFKIYNLNFQNLYQLF